MRKPTKNYQSLQTELFSLWSRGGNSFRPIMTVGINGKGVVDVDTVKGCSYGMLAYPVGGCYGQCYAFKFARRCGIDFSVSVTRRILRSQWYDIFSAVKNSQPAWYRIGTMGDPSHDWEHTIQVCERLSSARKTPVIVTKHWLNLSDEQIGRLRNIGALINTSTSGMDTEAEMSHRIREHRRLRYNGVRSVLRIVTCRFGDSGWAKSCNEKQSYLSSLGRFIDTPFRTSANNPRVINGDIRVCRSNNVGGGGGSKHISLNDTAAYLGTCGGCPDQCGININ